MLGSATSDEPSSSGVQETTPPPTISPASVEREQPIAQSTSPEVAAVVEGEDQQDSPSKTKRKNRCTTCRKKVGLTGETFHSFIG